MSFVVESLSKECMLGHSRGQMPGGFGPGGYGTADLDPFGRNTRGGGKI